MYVNNFSSLIIRDFSVRLKAAPFSSVAKNVEVHVHQIWFSLIRIPNRDQQHMKFAHFQSESRLMDSAFGADKYLSGQHFYSLKQDLRLRVFGRWRQPERERDGRRQRRSFPRFSCLRFRLGFGSLLIERSYFVGRSLRLCFQLWERVALFRHSKVAWATVPTL